MPEGDAVLEILCKYSVCIGTEAQKREFEKLKRAACKKLREIDEI